MTLRISIPAILASALILTGCNLHPQQSQDGSRLKTLAKLSQETPERRHMEIQSWQTPNGMPVLFVASSGLPMLDIRLTFAAGSSQDGSAFGLANLTNSLLGEGTGQQTADDIALAFENLGAQFGQGSYRDMAVASLRTLSDAKLSEPAFALFTRVVAQPSFPPDAITRIKNQLQADFVYQQKDPGYLASLALFKQLYGEHPYAHASAGTEASITKLTRQQLQSFHRQYYSAQNGQLVLVGDLSRARAEQIAAHISQALPQGQTASKVAQPIPPKPAHQHIDFPSAQTHILLAQLGIERGHPDYPALYLANQILGGSGFGSRLMEEVREKRGLTYGIYSSFNPMQGAGPFMISVQTRAELSQATLEFVRQLLRDFIEQGPTEQELASAKRELLGSFPLTAASNSAIVGHLGAIGFYKLSHSWLDDFMQDIQNITLEQVHQAVQQHLDADRLVMVTVGPQAEQLPLPEPIERLPSNPRKPHL